MSDLTNVVQFADLQIARQKDDYMRQREGCQHKRILLDDVGDTVKCQDCKMQVSAYWALKMLATDWREQTKRLAREVDAAKLATGLTLHLRAAKQVESVWRSKQLPCCPHCDRGIAADDNFGGRTVGKLFEQGLRVREAAEAKEKGLIRPNKLLPGKPKPIKAPAKPRSKVKPPPKWVDAPAWAQWLTSDITGKWTWHLIEPFLVEGSTPNYESGGMTAFAGTTPAPTESALIKQQRPRAESEGTAQ